jgi:hypothetical protein
MATHIFVNPDMTKEHGDIARLHVASDPPTAVTVTLFPSGKQEIQQMNADGFAISSDLFALAGGKAQLVVVTTADPRQPTTAILRQKVKTDDRMGTLVPSEDKAAGTSFIFPLEHLADGASVFIGNAGPAEAVGVLQYGTPRAPVAAPIKVARNGFQQIKITKTTTAGLVTITNAVNVVVQLALDTHGTDFDLMTILPVSRA